MLSHTSHLVKIQYGDYREAVERLSSGGPEVYAAQRYSVEFDAKLAQSCRVTIVALPPAPYDVVLPNGVRAIGLGWGEQGNRSSLLSLLERLRPSHLIVATPMIEPLAWGLLRAKHVLPLFADSFLGKSMRERVSYWALRTTLNHPKIEVVANHNFAASRSLAQLGVNPDKILPWDWPPVATPAANAPKRAPGVSDRFRVFYVGLVSEEKGVGDLIRAIALLRERNHDVALTVAGGGVIDDMKRRATECGISEQVQFLGRISHDQVGQLMREHDAVVVPSRSSYAEGLPMTVYEALCSRTPLLVSSHPMLTAALRGQQGALVFEEESPSSLADTLSKLMTNGELYEELSMASEATWQAIQVPLRWAELIERWLSGSSEDIEALKRYSLLSLGRL